MADSFGRVNDDFSQKVVVELDGVPWLASPAAGVKRKPLDRLGIESGRATTVVRFAKGSAFAGHTHATGEEYLVLDGVFSDETGGQGKMTYVRNPPGSSHVPFSDEGCTIFVKLCQMKPTDKRQFALDTNEMEWAPAARREGVFVKSLFVADGWHEEVALEKGGDGVVVLDEVFADGAEILLLDGALRDGNQLYETQSWVRFPKGARASLVAEGTVLYWIKRGMDF